MVAMVLFRLGSKSLWQDEGYTWSTVSRDWDGYLRLVRTAESQNLLYSIVMFGWERVGDTEAMLRLPSAMFIVLTVPAMYFAGRALHDTRVGVAAAGLFTVNAVAVEYGQEARAYALAVLLGALSIAGFATLVRRPSRRAWFRWVVPSALLVFSHPYALFTACAELASLVFLRPTGALRRWLLTGASVIGIVALPMLVLLATQEDSTSTAGLPPLGESIRYATGLFGKGGVLLVVAWVALLAFGVGTTMRLWPHASRIERWQLATTWCLPVGTLALVGAAALALDVFRTPHVVVALPSVVLAGATALARMPSRRALVVVSVLFVALSLGGVVKWYDDRPKQDWRSATAYVLDRAAAGDAVVFAADFGRIPFEYYARDDRRRDRVVPAYPAAAWGTWGTGDQGKVPLTRADLARLDRGNDRIWIVAGTASRNEPRFHGQDLGSLRRRFDRTFERHEKAIDMPFADGVHVFRYDVTGATRAGRA
jgi:mannosyltransferase